MSSEQLIPPTPEITDEDWQHTPASVRRLVLDLIRRVAQLEAEVSALREQNRLLQEQNQLLQEQNRLLQERLGQNSQNSSQPPSSDGPAAPERPAKKASGKPRGGQPGHVGHERRLYPVEQCQRVEDYRPRQCRRCGGRLSGDDPSPYRHQVVELPPIQPYVEEHRLHELTCAVCGTATRAVLPDGVTATGYGPRVAATVGLLSSDYRMSERMVEGFMEEGLGVWLSVGTVNGLRQEVSTAVAEPVAEAHTYVQQQAVVHADETGFKQGNADGGNPEGRKGWLWVAVTSLVVVFMVHLGRGQDAARALLGAAFAGRLVSDRWGGYNWVRLLWRQLCWAHLKREFTKMAERGGPSQRIGEALLEQEALLFAYWHRVRDGTLAWSTFQKYAREIRRRIKAILAEGADYCPAKGEHSARARTARTCRDLLKMEPAMWLFVRVQGIEPTNNAAERALRHAVLWRRTSFGTQSVAGSEFVARLLTVIMTLRAQKRNVLEYLTQACQAARTGQAVPSLLPVTP